MLLRHPCKRVSKAMASYPEFLLYKILQNREQPISFLLFSLSTTQRRPWKLSALSSQASSDIQSDPNNTSIVPLFGNQSFSQDAAMGLVLSAASIRGWTTGSGMEGPSVPARTDHPTSTEQVSTFPWSLFTKSPRRRMRVAFTCNVCGQRTTRAINPHAYTDGTVFIQCCGCNVFHKLVDNLNLFHGMNCYVNPSFNYKRDLQWDVGFKLFDEEDDADGDANVF